MMVSDILIPINTKPKNIYYLLVEDQYQCRKEVKLKSEYFLIIILSYILVNGIPTYLFITVDVEKGVLERSTSKCAKSKNVGLAANIFQD